MLGCSSASSGACARRRRRSDTDSRRHQLSRWHTSRSRIPKTDIDARDLITSITRRGFVRAQSGQRRRRRSERDRSRSPRAWVHVRDLDVSPDGTKIVFSLRLPLNPKKTNTDVTQPNWHIYQYDATTKTVTQLTNDSHHRRSRCGRALPAGRQNRIFLDAADRHPIDPAGRRPAAVPGPDRRSPAVHILVACDERRWHQACIRSASIPIMISRRLF